MVNNVLFVSSGQYALGGLINGEADGIIITKDNDSEIFDILFNTGVRLSLTNRYCLAKEPVGVPGTLNLYHVKELVSGDLIGTSAGERAKIINISRRNGVGIFVRKQSFTLNLFPVWQDCEGITVNQTEKCIYLSDDMVEEEIKICCGRVDRKERPLCHFFDKGIKVSQCIECSNYKNKRTNEIPKEA